MVRLLEHRQVHGLQVNHPHVEAAVLRRQHDEPLSDWQTGPSFTRACDDHAQ